MNKALEGVTILDFSHLLQGPFATQLLADMGANVIKIERAGAGDMFRSMTFFAKWVGGSESPNFLAWNRNKRSIALNLKSRKVHAILMDMAKKADVVVQNFRPGVLARLGYGYEDFKAVNPRIIYCSGSGYGEDGPYVDRPGQDMLIQGLAGLVANTGRGDCRSGAGGRRPRRPDRRDEHGLRHPLGALLSGEDRQGPEDRGEPPRRHARASRAGIRRRPQSRRGFRPAQFRHRPPRHAGAVRHLRDARRPLRLDRHEPLQDALRDARGAAPRRLRRSQNPVRQARRGLGEGQRRDEQIRPRRPAASASSPPTSGARRSTTSARRPRIRRSSSPR